jgi:hypothetical protein
MENDDPTTPFSKCPTCKALVVARCWHPKDAIHAGPHWQVLDTPVTPVLGMPHVCPHPEESTP